MLREKIDFYRERAVELRKAAEVLRTAECQEAFHRLADLYERLADDVARLFLDD